MDGSLRHASSYRVWLRCGASNRDTVRSTGVEVLYPHEGGSCDPHVGQLVEDPLMGCCVKGKECHYDLSLPVCVRCGILSANTSMVLRWGQKPHCSSSFSWLFSSSHQVRRVATMCSFSLPTQERSAMGL